MPGNPWSDSLNITAEQADNSFFVQWGAICPSWYLLQKVSSDGTIVDSVKTQVANAIYSMYSDEWGKLAKVFSLNYEILNSADEKTITEIADNEQFQHGHVVNSINSGISSLWGFNSSGSVNSDSDSSDSNTTNSGTDTNIRNNTHTTTRTGQTIPAQDLISKEWEVWKKNYFAIVYNDILKVIASPIYEMEEI
jgi:hypothetical protein